MRRVLVLLALLSCRETPKNEKSEPTPAQPPPVLVPPSSAPSAAATIEEWRPAIDFDAAYDKATMEMTLARVTIKSPDLTCAPRCEARVHVINHGTSDTSELAFFFATRQTGAMDAVLVPPAIGKGDDVSATVRMKQGHGALDKQPALLGMCREKQCAWMKIHP